MRLNSAHINQRGEFIVLFVRLNQYGNGIELRLLAAEARSSQLAARSQKDLASGRIEPRRRSTGAERQSLFDLTGATGSRVSLFSARAPKGPQKVARPTSWSGRLAASGQVRLRPANLLAILAAAPIGPNGHAKISEQMNSPTGSVTEQAAR